MRVTQNVVICLGLIFARLALLGLPAALVDQAVLAVLVAMVATADQSRPSELGPLLAVMQVMAPMAKQALEEPLAAKEMKELMQRLQFLIPTLVSQPQLKRAQQGLPETKGLVATQELTAR